MTKTRDAVEIIRKRFGHLPGFEEGFAQETVNVRVAMLVYEAREKAGLTQQQLADLVGTTQQVISRLEDADYEGHSLSMVQRIADALHQRIELRFVPLEPASR